MNLDDLAAHILAVSNPEKSLLLKNLTSLEIVVFHSNAHKRIVLDFDQLCEGDMSVLPRFQKNGIEFCKETNEIYYATCPHIRCKVVVGVEWLGAIGVPNVSAFVMKYLRAIPLSPAAFTLEGGQISVPALSVADVVKILPSPIFRELEPFLPVNIATFLQ